MSSESRRYKAGHPPHDPVNGFRVGAVVGGVLGAIAVWVFDVSQFGIVLGGGVLGGAVGYLSEKSKQRL